MVQNFLFILINFNFYLFIILFILARDVNLGDREKGWICLRLGIVWLD